MGSFYRASLIWTLLFSGWGVATGIGLLRAWRWARISTLIFSGLLAAGCLLAIVALLRIPAGDVLDWTVMVSRIAVGRGILVPMTVGIWWLVFFNRKDVKAHFHART